MEGKDKVDVFVNIARCSGDMARRYLLLSGGNLEMGLNQFFTDQQSSMQPLAAVQQSSMQPLAAAQQSSMQPLAAAAPASNSVPPAEAASSSCQMEKKDTGDKRRPMKERREPPVTDNSKRRPPQPSTAKRQLSSSSSDTSSSSSGRSKREGPRRAARASPPVAGRSNAIRPSRPAAKKGTPEKPPSVDDIQLFRSLPNLRSFYCEGSKFNSSALYQVCSAKVDPGTIDAPVVSGWFDFPCIKPSLWKHFFNASSFSSTAFVQNFMRLAALLAHSCPSCRDIAHPLNKDFRRLMIEIGASTDTLRVTEPANFPSTLFVFKNVKDSPAAACCDPLFHRILVHTASNNLPFTVHCRNWRHQDGVLSVDVAVTTRMQQGATNAEPLALLEMREALCDVVERFAPEGTYQRGVFPFVTNITIQGWAEVAAEECQTPGELLRLVERSTLQYLPDEVVPAEIDGLTLSLKQHQQESVTMMLCREREGLKDYVEVPLPSSCIMYVNLITTMVTVQCPKWASDWPPPASPVFGGILADEMGLGKTVEILALSRINQPYPSMPQEIKRPLHEVMVIRHRERSDIRVVRDTYINLKATLLVVPVSITGQWMAEISRCCPGTRALLFHGSDRERSTIDDFRAADFILTTYETLMSTLEKENRSVARHWLVLQDDTVHAAIRRLSGTSHLQWPQIPGYTNDNYSHIRTVCKDFASDCVRLSELHFNRIVFDECQKYTSGRQLMLSANHWWAASGTPFDATIGPLRDLLGLIGFSTAGRNAPFQNCYISSTSTQWDGKKTYHVKGVKFSEERQAISNSFHVNVYGVSTLNFAIMPAPDATSLFDGWWMWALLGTAHIIRHSKTESVTSELCLPPKTVVIHRVEPGPAELALYRRVEARVQERVRALQHRQRLTHHVSSLLQWVIALRRAAAHPSLADADDVTPPEAQGATGVSTRNLRFTKMECSRAKEDVLKRFGPQSAAFEVLEKLGGDPPEIEECGVCLDTMQLPTMLVCGHFFCRECVLRLITEAKRISNNVHCPMCRGEFINSPLVEVVVQSVAALTPEEIQSTISQMQQVGQGCKIRAMLNLIQSTLNADPSAQFVVFSSFPALMRLAAASLATHNIPHAVIDGGTTLSLRSRLVREFQGGIRKVCIISSKTGNAGLTLTAGNHLILLEPNVNVAVDAQAQGRIHRFGQQRPVTIHRLINAGTAEDRVQALLDAGLSDASSNGMRLSRTNSTAAPSRIGLAAAMKIILGDRNT